MSRTRVALLFVLAGVVALATLWALRSVETAEHPQGPGSRIESEATFSTSELLLPARAEPTQPQREEQRGVPRTATVELTLLSPRGDQAFSGDVDFDVSWSRSREAPGKKRSKSGRSVIQWHSSAGPISESGRWQIPGLPVGIPLEFRIEHPFGPDWFGGVDALLAGETRTVVAQLAAGVFIRGRVLEDNGKPVNEARVTAQFHDRRPSDLRGTWPEGVSTDERGEFELGPLAAGTWELGVHDRKLIDGGTKLTRLDREAITVDLIVQGEAVLTVHLSIPPEVTSSLRTVVSVTGSGYSADLPTFGSSLQFDRVPAGVCRVSARAEVGGQILSAESEVTVARETAVTLTLGSLATATLHGRIMDERGVARGGIQLALERTGRLEAETDSNGAFTIRGLEPGSWLLLFEDLEYAIDCSWIEVREDPTYAEVVLPRRGTVRGRVLDAQGRPVANVAISEIDWRKLGSPPKSDESGAFELRLEPGRHVLFAYHGKARSEVRLLDLEPAATVEGFDLLLVPSAKITGQVVDAQDRPLVGARITSDHLGQEFETDHEGRFILPSFPSGTSTLFARCKEQGAELHQTVTVTPGQNLDVLLRVPAAEPVPFSLTLRRHGKPFSATVRLATDGHFRKGRTVEGRLDLDLQQPGTWRALLSALDHESDLQSARVLDFEAPAEGTVELDLDWEELLPPSSHAELEAWLRP